MGNTQPIIVEKSVKDQIRDQKRAIDRSIRNIEREKTRVIADEKKMKVEIKKMAKAGQHKAAMGLAKDIVRMKNQGEKMGEFVGQLKAVSLRISGINSLNELSNAMEMAGNAITLVSGKLDAAKLAQLAQTLSREDEKLEMKSEMMSDIMDGMGESMDDPAEQERIYKSVLEEVGIDIAQEMPEAISKNSQTTTQAVAQQKAVEDDSLDQMLKDLQK